MKNLLYLAFLFVLPLSNSLLAQADTMALEVTICEGEVYEFNNEVLSASGNYTASYINQSGYDSTVLLTLVVHPSDWTEIWVDLCLLEPSPFYGIVYGQTGNYTETWDFQNQYGCDSLVTAHLFVKPEELYFGWASVPYGFVLNGDTLTDTNQIYGYTTFDTTENGCVSIHIIEIHVMPSSTDELEASTNLLVYPNPVRDEINMKFELPQSWPVSISLLDGYGRLVSTLMDAEMLPMGAHELHFAPPDLAAGLYLLRFQADGKSFYRKLVKV